MLEKKKNILMIVENFFPNDHRVRKEAEVLKKRFNVCVIALRNYKSEKLIEVIEGVRVFRIPEFPALPFVKLSYMLEYLYFTGVAVALFLISHFIYRYKVVHVHNPPDTLFIIGLLCRCLSVKFVFDHHDLMPELYLTKFPNKKNILYWMLLFSEKLSCRLANVIISTNQSYKDLEISRHNIKRDKIFIVRNDPIIDECTNYGRNDAFHSNSDKKALLFLGGINMQDGVDFLLYAISYLVYTLNRKDVICNIVGSGDYLETVKVIAAELNLNDYVDFKGQVFDREKIKKYLDKSDIGIEPAPDNELNRHCTFIKVMEYMAAAKPIVAFDLKETRYSANGSAILIPSGDVKRFAEAIVKLLDDAELRQKLGTAGFARVSSQLTWEKAAANLQCAYESLNMIT